MRAYDRICAYMAIWIEEVTGVGTIDHMIPRSVDWNHVYEWDNYRLACSLMNSRKNDAIAVLDPFQVEPGWFELDLVGMQVRASGTVSPNIRDRLERTIERLRLNENDCRAARRVYFENHIDQSISYAYLCRRAPFLAMEIRRQGFLRNGDQESPP